MDNLPEKIDFLVLGATGMQGKIVVRDLTENGHTVIASGTNDTSLNKLAEKYNIPTFKLDLKESEKLMELIKKTHPKVIVNCAEGDWNVAVYKAALETGTDVIDLGSDIPTTKEQFAMHNDFKAKNLIAITGCGSTPGVNNIMLDYASQFFDQIDTISAGFAWNSNIKTFVVPFSMESIIEEFTDPASIVENNVWADRVPMDSVQDRDFKLAGAQKMFFVRHPEPYTFYENYKGKGAKNVYYYAGFPSHSFDLIKALIPEGGFNGNKFVTLPERGQVPFVDLTRVMQELHPQPAGYEEQENLWVTIEGVKDGNKKTIQMECLVPTLPGWEEAGCNIDTGLPASIIAQMVFKREINTPGSFAPETIVPHIPFFKALAARQMSVWKDGERVSLEES